MRTANEIMDEFFGKREELEKTLTELSQKAKVLRDQQDKCNAAEDEIKALNESIPALRVERESLKAKYSEAQFEGDVSEQQKIVKRRTAIDKELGEKQKEIQRLETSIDENSLDAHECVDVQVTLDMLSTPAAADFAEEVKTTLVREQTDLRQQIEDVDKLIPSFPAALYNEERKQRQPGWKTEKEIVQEQLRRERARLTSPPRKHYQHEASNTSDFLERNKLIKRDDNKRNNVKATAESNPGPLTEAEIKAVGL